MILKRNQFSLSSHKRILAIILSASLVLIALHLLNFQCSSKSPYLQARKGSLPRVTSQSLTTYSSIVKNLEKSSTNSKPFLIVLLNGPAMNLRKMTRYIVFLREFNKYLSQITNIFSINTDRLFKQYSDIIRLSNTGSGFKKMRFHLRINQTFSKCFQRLLLCYLNRIFSDTPSSMNSAECISTWTSKHMRLSTRS